MAPDPLINNTFEDFPNTGKKADGPIVGRDSKVFFWFWDKNGLGTFPWGWEVADADEIVVVVKD